MKRFLKKRFGKLLPEGLRTSVKNRLRSKFVEPVSTTFVVEETSFAFKCTIDNRWSFLAPVVCKNDLANLTDTAEGRAEFHSLAQAAQAGGALFDIGAHSGLISAMFCGARADNKAFAFEPSPVLAERLTAIRELNQFGDRFNIEQVGIGQESKTMEMILDPAGGFVQSQHFQHTMWAAPQSIQIRLESIPDASRRLGVVPTFIKIDIEGYEYEAIAGSATFLTDNKPTIFLELHLNYLEQRNLSPKLLVERLTDCGYSFRTSAGTSLKPREVYDSPLPIVHVVAQ